MTTLVTPLYSYSSHHRSFLAQPKQATYPVAQIQSSQSSHMQQQKVYVENEELLPFFCRALYDYEAQDGSALSFRCGDIIEVLTREQSGWWDGLFRNKRGWFPSDYVEVIPGDQAEQAFLAANSLAAEALVLKPSSISSMGNVSQAVMHQVYQAENEKWLKSEVLASRMSENPTAEKSRMSDRWIPGVRSDGKIVYMNTQNGRHSYEMPQDGDVSFSDSESAGPASQTFIGPVTRAGFTSRRNGSFKRTEIKQDIARPGIISRPSTPEQWEKSEDGHSHFNNKKADGRTMSTWSEAVYNTSSQPIASPLRHKAANSNNKHPNQYSNNFYRHSRQTLVRTSSTTNEVPRQPSAETHTRPTALANTRLEHTIAERIARSLQQIVAPSLPEGVIELATTAESVIQATLDNIRMNGLTRRPEEDVQLNDLIYDVVAVVRNLLYALAVPTLQIPQNVLPREVREPSSLSPSPLKPAQRTLTATLSRLILSARAIQYNTGLSVADILSRLEIDAEGLKKDVLDFIRQVQELKHRSKLPRRKYPKRLHGAFSTQNVGPGLVGAGAAGRWKGFGWISLDEEQAASRRTLGVEVVSQLRLAWNDHNIRFQSFLHILQTPHQSSVEQIRLSGRQLVSQISSFVNCTSDIHVARHVDIDGLLQDGTGPYGLTIESAQRLVRKLEAVTQAVNDDTSAFLLALQSLPESHLPRYRQRRIHACDRLGALASALTANMTVMLETLCALLSLGHEQAELSLSDYNGSIEWRMSRLRPLSTNIVKNSSDVVIVPETLSRNSGTSETLESSSEFNPTNNTPPSEDEGESRVIQARKLSLRHDNKPVSTQVKPRKSLGKEDVNNTAIASEPWYFRSTYNEELMVTYDNTVKGGTPRALVERLTAHDKFDPSFNRAFLMTFKSFMTINELIDLLFARFRIEPPPDLKPGELESWKRHKQQLVQLRVLNTFITILKDDSILETEDIHILERLKTFISSDKVSRVGAAKEVLVYIERLIRNDNNTPKVVMRSPPPPPLYPKKLKLTDIKPLELARQLTLMESNLYRKIKSLECLQRPREQKAENMDHIANVIQMSNRIADWVAECVLSKEDARKRAIIVTYFISVADYCRTLNNFSSIMAITSGLTTQPIHRLKRTWELVGQQSMEQFAICESIFESAKNVNKYRQVMEVVNPPCVPFIGVFLTALQFIHDGNPDMFEGGFVNFRKRQRAVEIITDITRWQPQPFNLEPIPFVQTWIEESLSRFNDTKAWSDQFWALSTELEPRAREDEKMARLLQESGFL